jgi:6-phosphogluconolactonase (cycloisomerase 2 family)
VTTYLVGGYGAGMGGSVTGIRWARSGPDGSFEAGEVAVECPSPSWLTVHGERVFATLEGTGELAVFRIEGARLMPEARVPAGGSLPCHLAVVGGAAVVACYGDGAVAVHAPVGASPRVLAGSGHGPREEQQGPHAHHVLVRGDRVLTLDLGADAVHVHDLGMTRLATVELPPGTGPRDLLALPDGRLVLLGELSGEVILLGDSLEILHRERLLGFADGDHAAGLALVHGRYIATGIRGGNLIATLAVTDAGVRAIASVPSGGDWPRHLVADGTFVHVANQASGTVTTFAIDAGGVPEPVGAPVVVPSPTCLAPVGGAPNL